MRRRLVAIAAFTLAAKGCYRVDTLQGSNNSNHRLTPGPLAAALVMLFLVCLSGFAEAASPASVAADIPLTPEIASGDFLVKLSEASGENPRPIPGRVWQKFLPDCDGVIGSSYCHNDPVNKYDVLGLYDEKADAALTAINEEIALLDKVIEVQERAKTRHWITLNKEIVAGTEFIGGPGDRKHDEMQAQLSGYEDQRYELSVRRGELIQQRGQTTTEKVVWNGLAAVKGVIQLTGVDMLMAKDFEETPVMGIINLANMASGLEDSQPLADGFFEDLKTTEGKVRLAGAPFLILRGKVPIRGGIDPSAIRFSQSNVRNTLPEITQSMRANGWQGKPIDVVRMADGGLTAVDNTRLAAAGLTRTPVQATIRNFDDAFDLARGPQYFRNAKTGALPQTWGEAILNRISNQLSLWRQQYPSGAPVTGVHPTTPAFTP